MSTDSTTEAISLPAVEPSVVKHTLRRLRSRLLHRGSLIAVLYLMMAPTIISMAVFSYYPKADVVIKAFYQWTPNEVLNFVGLKNFSEYWINATSPPSVRAPSKICPPPYQTMRAIATALSTSTTG